MKKALLVIKVALAALGAVLIIAAFLHRLNDGDLWASFLIGSVGVGVASLTRLFR